EAPQVVARRAALAGRADRLPLEQVVGTRLATFGGHPAIRLDHPRTAADEKEHGQGIAAGALREEQPRVAGRSEGLPDVAVGALGADQEPGPVGRLAVDAVEVTEPVAADVDHFDPAGACLV